MNRQQLPHAKPKPDVMLDIMHLSKRFPGVLAVDDVSFQAYRGEVHVLIGENGAGKSTVMKMVAGLYPIDAGSLQLDGAPYAPQNVAHATAQGVSIIHQELNMMDHRTVAQNMFVGRELRKKRFPHLVDHAAINRACQAVLDSLGIDIPPTALIKDLSIAQQQMVEVAKALSHQNKVLIMDEPTSSLTSKEISKLFEIVRKLKADGLSIIYISHRLEELMEIGDRVTVMRDGRYVGTRDIQTINIDELITMMVGREIKDVYNRTYRTPGAEMIRTSKLSGLRFRNVDLEVRAGEVVGLAGLVGAGRTELAKAIFGYDPIESGSLWIMGKAIRVRRHTPSNSIAHSVSFLPEDRKAEGLFLRLTVKSNIVQVNLKSISRGGVIRRRLETATAQAQIEALRIATPSPDKLVYELSGGNQQKVVVAKWLLTKSRIFIFDEPTRGIDVGAKQEIYQIIQQLAEQGASVLIISSDMPELIGLSDRIYTMKDGEITGELNRAERPFQQEEILRLILEGRK